VQRCCRLHRLGFSNRVLSIWQCSLKISFLEIAAHGGVESQAVLGGAVKVVARKNLIAKEGGLRDKAFDWRIQKSFRRVGSGRGSDLRVIPSPLDSLQGCSRQYYRCPGATGLWTILELYSPIK
jgi:hypothetical protein